MYKQRARSFQNLGTWESEESDLLCREVLLITNLGKDHTLCQYTIPYALALILHPSSPRGHEP
ncbi:MAG: hypothetical protein JXB30_19885 [Anaerolineae bacterium]|nr:hypothetical protein [Anaerolineae bacterium]